MGLNQNTIAQVVQQAVRAEIATLRAESATAATFASGGSNHEATSSKPRRRSSLTHGVLAKETAVCRTTLRFTLNVDGDATPAEAAKSLALRLDRTCHSRDPSQDLAGTLFAHDEVAKGLAAATPS